MNLGRWLAWIAMGIVAFAACAVIALWLLRSGTLMPGETYSRSGHSFDAPDALVEDRLRQHVWKLAGQGQIGPRHMGRPEALEAAASYIESQLQGFGYETEREIFAVDSSEAANIVAEIKGETDEIVIVGAHYDTVPDSPGANDNATGVAALLELARLHRSDATRPTVRFVAFVNEERPYFLTSAMGSAVHAKRSRQRGEHILCMFSLETIGFYTDEPNSQSYPFPYSLFYPKTGNFVGFVANTDSRNELHRAISAFRSQAAIDSEGLAAPRIIADINRSDQISFWKYGIPAIMVTDTVDFRYEHYHEPTDTPDVVAYPELAKVVMGLTAVMREFMQ